MVGLGVLVATAPLLLLSRLECETQYHTTLRPEDIAYLPAPEALPLLSLGWRQALADLMWVSALVYFGNQISEHGQLRHLTARTDAILALDPSFRDVYKWIAVVVVYNSGRITRGDIETSNRYLERGIRAFPRDGELRYLLAFNYAVEMTPFVVNDEERLAFMRKAADLFHAASRLPGAPSDAALMAAEMSEQGGGRRLAIQHLRMLIPLASEDRIRDQLVQRLAGLASQEEAEALDADRIQFRDAWKRDYPYLPVGIFGLVGERLSSTVDEPAPRD
ncbi:MAG: hypothetical protein HYY06_01005 [Deltaproteobacteria bacterium]|nr:hypothetical protein [Deltaproteobacteria bacterium]